MSIGTFDSSNLNAGQKVAVKYFTVAIVLFVAQILFGLLAGIQFIAPDFLYNVLDFNVNRMVHINAMIVWMLYGFIGSGYWLVEDESGIPLVGAKLANRNFWIFLLHFLNDLSGPDLRQPAPCEAIASETWEEDMSWIEIKYVN